MTECDFVLAARASELHTGVEGSLCDLLRKKEPHKTLQP